MAGIAWPGGLDATISFTRDIWKFKVSPNSHIILEHWLFPKAKLIFFTFGWEIQPQDHCPSSCEVQVQLPLLCPAHWHISSHIISLLSQVSMAVLPFSKNIFPVKFEFLQIHGRITTLKWCMFISTFGVFTGLSKTTTFGAKPRLRACFASWWWQWWRCWWWRWWRWWWWWWAPRWWWWW